MSAGLRWGIRESNGAIALGALTGVAAHQMTMSLLDGLRQAAADRNDRRALAAWEAQTQKARSRGNTLFSVARNLMQQLLASQDEVAALRQEVEDLRAAVAHREGVIRSIGQQAA